MELTSARPFRTEAADGNGLASFRSQGAAVGPIPSVAARSNNSGSCSGVAAWASGNQGDQVLRKLWSVPIRLSTAMQGSPRILAQITPWRRSVITRCRPSI